MEHECPIRKAWREFAMADPDDCAREWAACLALGSDHETASISSPTASTSSVSPLTSSTPPLHNRVHGPAVVSSLSTTRSTASLQAPSGDMSSTAVSEESASPWDRDNVYPPLAELRRALMTDAEWAAMSEWDKDLWEMKQLPEKERMNSIDGIVMWLPAAQREKRRKELLEEVLRFGEPAPTFDSSKAVAPTTSNISTRLPGELELDDPVAPTPATCLAECPSKDAPAPVSVIILSTTSNSSTIICDAVPEHDAPAVSDKVFDVDAMGDTTISAAVCLPADPDHNICGEDLVSKSQTLWSAPTSFSLLPGNPPSSTCEPMGILELYKLSATTCSTDCSCRSTEMSSGLLPQAYKEFIIGYPVCTFVPWPPPIWNRAITPMICGQDSCHDAQQKRGSELLVSLDNKENWNAIWLDVELKPPWIFLGVCMNLPMGWIYQHIFRGNTHYSEQIQWSFSHSVLQFQFCTALVQSENFWKINLVPLKSWFQCCCAQRESIYGSENFQWTIAWSEKCQLKIARLLDFAFTEWKPWPSRVCFCVVYVSASACGPGVPLFWWFQFDIKNSFVFRDKLLLSITIQLQPWPSWQESNYTLASKRVRIQWSILNVNWALEELSRMTNWAFEEEKGQMLLSVPWLSFRCHWVAACPALLGKIPTGHPHADPYSYAGSFVLHWTSFFDENQMHLLTAAETFWRKLLSVGETGDCLQYEHLHESRPPDQTTELLSRLTSNHFPTELFVIEHWLIPWEPRHDSPGHNLKGNFTSLSVACDLVYSVSGADMLLATRSLLWCVRCVQFDTDGPRNCVVFLQPKPPWSDIAPTNSVDVADSLCIAGVSMEFKQFGPFASHGRRLSQGWILYLPVTCIVQCGSELMPWENAKSRYANWTYTKQVLISWDPGGSVPVLDAATDVNCNSIPLLSLKLTWDPGGYRQHPLEGKPDFKEGGLSTTCLQELSHGLPHWAVACLAARYEDREAYIPKERPHQDAAWNGTDGLGLEGEDSLACCVRLLFCVIFFL